MAASSSSSCKSRTSTHRKQGDVRSRTVDRGQGSKEDELCACDTFCHASQQNIAPEFNQSSNPCHDIVVIGECDVKSSISARKLHKADREKLRRDRLNEQLLELAGALEPDRPKNDKSTILGDTIQCLKELMTEVERLRAEHTSLTEETTDLSQEKKELKDEKLQLKSMVEHLQSQVQQQMHAMFFWMTPDPSSMMNAGPFSYSPPSVPHGASDADVHLRPGQVQFPLGGPIQRNGYMPMPVVPGSMAVHPAVQTQYGYNPMGAPYFPYPFNFSNTTSQAETSSAQAPPPVTLSASGYPMQICPMQPISVTATYPQTYGPEFLYMPPPALENRYGFNSGLMAGAAMALSRQAEEDQVSSSPKTSNDEHDAEKSGHVQTALQLQTPSSLSSPPQEESTRV